MRLLLSKIIAKDRFFYVLIMLLALARVLTSKVRACPPDFDCESYLAMLQHIGFDPTIPGHHAMRILPALLARMFNTIGFTPTTSFQIVSGFAYCLLGILVYWVLRKEKQPPWIAFAFTLLCLAPHHAIRISLQLVYQSCDMMTYPLMLGILYCSFKKRVDGIFILSLLGILTRQNLFILGELSLLYCFFKDRKIKPIYYAVLLGIAYFWLQLYYHASGVFSELLHPPEGYFTVSHLTQIFIESKLIELVVPLIPFLIISYREIIKFFVQYWHLAIYMAIVVGQPMLGYHLTGNNFQRLALQGVWVLFLACALTYSRSQSRDKTIALVIYSFAMYFVWSMSERVIFVALYLGVLLAWRFGFLFSPVPKRL